MFNTGDRVMRVNHSVSHVGVCIGEIYGVARIGERTNGDPVIMLMGYGSTWFDARSFELLSWKGPLSVCSTDYMLNKNLDEEDRRIIGEALCLV